MPDPVTQSPAILAQPSSAPVHATSEMYDEQEDAEASIGEMRFRKGLSAEGEMFIAELIEDCPGGFSPYFTETNRELRVRLNTGKQRRLLVMTPSGTGFQCKTLASVEICQLIGINAKPSTPGETVMTACFWLDPAVDRPATLFAVLGAAAQMLVPSF